MRIETKTLRRAHPRDILIEPANETAGKAGAILNLNLEVPDGSEESQGAWLTREECLHLGTALLEYAMGFTPKDDT